MLVLEGVSGPTGSTPLRVREVSLTVPAGEVCAVIGPSGSGKTTLLRLVAGLEPLADGTIELEGVRIDGLSVGDRDVALVTQESNLYRHFDVGDNVAFPLRLRKVEASEREARVAAESRVHRLRHLLRRKVTTLSAGEQQAASLARGTVRLPSLMLLDEPLARLDAVERARLRTELARYLRSLSVPTLLATNDQREAMTLAARATVLRDGRMEQTGSPQQLYAEPASAFVAGFIGDPGANLLPGRVVLGQRTAQVRVGEGSWHIEPPVGAVRRLDDVPVTVGVRPEHLRLVGQGEGVPARVEHVERLGDRALVHLDVAGVDGTVVVRVGRVEPAVAERVGIDADPGQVRLFDPVDGTALPLR